MQAGRQRALQAAAFQAWREHAEDLVARRCAAAGMGAAAAQRQQRNMLAMSIAVRSCAWPLCCTCSKSLYWGSCTTSDASHCRAAAGNRKGQTAAAVHADRPGRRRWQSAGPGARVWRPLRPCSCWHRRRCGRRGRPPCPAAQPPCSWPPSRAGGSKCRQAAATVQVHISYIGFMSCSLQPPAGGSCICLTRCTGGA